MASMRSLEAAGRVKDIEFPNNSTTEHVRELLLNSFGNHLNAADVDRLHFYKTVASSNLLDLAGRAEEMHWQRLKTTFQNRSKVFMRLLLDSNGSVIAPQVDSGDAIVDTEQERRPTEEGNENTLVNISDDDQELLLPLLASSPQPVSTQQQSSASTEMFVNRFYDKVHRVEMLKQMSDTIQNATVVVEINEMEYNLGGAELDQGSGPLYDTKVVQRLFAANRIPQRIPTLCLTPLEMQLQSYMDMVPVCIVRYRLTDKSIDCLRGLMMSNAVVQALTNCQVHFALMGSDFDKEACGKQHRRVDDIDLEIHVLQPTMSSNKVILGDVVTGNTEAFTRHLISAVGDALEATSIVKSQRDLLQQQRELRQRQDHELRQSEIQDREKERSERERQETEDAQQSEEEDDETVVDSEQVRQKRILALENQQAMAKRMRREDEDGHDDDDDNSGIVTFNRGI
ncbi:hypothetical protein P5673_009589 [Acropora cervicornis]|uniref:Uncharacterized protein n=1 Tax=Acropora cervicornis TaxID=6130 RepID=A0AAD9QRL1_ACRCE|nr:hypothetical protein P5673_009589 [Acropora cervicornis]